MKQKQRSGFAILETALCMVPLTMLTTGLGVVSWVLFQRQAMEDVVDRSTASFSVRPYILETEPRQGTFHSSLVRNQTSIEDHLQDMLEKIHAQLKERFPEAAEDDYAIQVGYQPITRKESNQFLLPRKKDRLIFYKKGMLAIGDDSHLSSEMDRYQWKMYQDPALLQNAYYVNHEETLVQEMLLLGVKIHISFAHNTIGKLVNLIIPEAILSVGKVMPFRGGIGS